MGSYRGKYPNRIKSVSYGRESGWHVETNRGDKFAFTSKAEQAAIVAAYPLRGIETGMDIFDVLANVPAKGETEQPATLNHVSPSRITMRPQITPCVMVTESRAARFIRIAETVTRIYGEGK